jgi:hypothetical protein
MKQNSLTWVIFLLLVAISMSACAGETTATVQPAPYPARTEPATSGGDQDAYPAPTRPASGDLAYPGPDQPVSSDQGSALQGRGYDPQPADESWNRGGVFADRFDVMMLESYPVQVHLQIVGNLPDPCHQFRAVVSEPDEQHQIKVDVYSVADPEMMCVQTLVPFEQSVALGDFTEGDFTVWVNGAQVGEFHLP